MAASAKLASHVASGAARKYNGTGLTQDFMSAEMGVDQELHLKMSKKIAQLTKVIYALNTKNDEHEHVVKAMQLQHDKELQQLMADTKSKLDALRNKVSSESELRKKIEGLEQSVAEHEKQRKRLLQDLELNRRDSLELEAALKAEHAQSVVGLSKELVRVQKDYEMSVAQFRQAFEAIERDKAEATADMRKAHQIEIDQLLRAQNTQSSNIAEELALARRTHEAEIASLTAAVDKERQEKRSVAAECEQKLDAARELHARELEAVHSAQNRTADERVRLLQEQCDKLTKDAQFQESLHRRRVDELASRLGAAEEACEKLRGELSQSNTTLELTSNRLTTAESRLTETRKDAEQLRSLHEKAISDLRAAKETCSFHEAESRRQAAHLLEVETLLSAEQIRVQQLLDELAASARKLAMIEKEKNELATQSHGTVTEKTSRIVALEQMVEDARSEIMALHKRHEAELARLNAHTAEELQQHRVELQQLQAMAARYQADAEEARVAAGIAATAHEKAWQLQLQQQSEKHRAEVELLTADLEAGSSSLRVKLTHAEAEVLRLNQAIQTASSELLSKSSELMEVHQQMVAVQHQLDCVSTELAAAYQLTADLRMEKEELARACHQLEEQHRIDLEHKLSEQNRLLTSEWAEKLRAEVEQLRAALLAQFAAERAAAELQLSESNERSLDALRRRLESKSSELALRVSQLEAALVNQEHSAEGRLSELRADFERQIAALTVERNRLIAEHAAELEQAVARSLEEIRVFQAQKEQEVKELTMLLKTKHLEDLQAQMAAHKVALAAIQKEAAETRAKEIAAKAEAFARDLDSAKKDMLQAHADEMDSVSQNANRQIATARMELQRAVELKAQKEREFHAAAEEMNIKLNTKETHIRNMETSIEKYLHSIEHLNKELDLKGKEILKVRSDANQQLRKREESLMKEHRAESEKLASEHTHQVQRMLEDFNQAQEMLKEKIAALQIMLEEAEERYRNRESRPEDLDAIEHLRDLVNQLEAEVQRLLDEKRYYQMELVNRETNFNKVFSAAPQVGLINPLAKKKKGEKGPTKYTVSSPVIGAPNGAGMSMSSATASGRLRPIAGSPVHDEPINPNHVLPPPQAFAKRFVQ